MGATHTGDDNLYYKYTSNGYMLLENGEWDYVTYLPDLRRLDDIARLTKESDEVKIRTRQYEKDNNLITEADAFEEGVTLTETDVILGGTQKVMSIISVTEKLRKAIVDKRETTVDTSIPTEKYEVLYSRYLNMTEKHEVLSLSEKYVVLGIDTHFTYNAETKEVFCTHGGWGGTLVTHQGGDCEVLLAGGETIYYHEYKFTQANSYDEALEQGDISFPPL